MKIFFEKFKRHAIYLAELKQWGIKKNAQLYGYHRKYETTNKTPMLRKIQVCTQNNTVIGLLKNID